MSLNFNVSPYYDDFDPTKEFYRILFQPGRAVQARELTQIQSMLQNQIASFGQNIFTEGSVVSGGQHQLDDSAFYLKVSPTFYNGVTTVNVDYSNIVGKYILEQSTGKIGYVKQFSAATATDPPTLFVSIVQGKQSSFADSSTFTVYDTQTSITPSFYFTSLTGASGTCLLFHISKGVFFSKNTFCYCPDQTVVVGKYTKTPSAIIGLNVVESIVDYIDDPSLLDPALGASNYLAPGADRYKIDLELTTQPYVQPAITYPGFIQLTTVVNGSITNDITTPIYSTIMDTMAKRSYDTNGNFIVKNFLPSIQNDTQDTTKLILNISAGSAFVQGYEIETQGPTNLLLNKAQTTATDTGTLVNTTYGNYTYVNTLYGGLPDINSSSTTYFVELHNVSTGQTAASKIGTALVRSIEYASGVGTSAIFALFLDDITMTSASFPSTKSFYSGNYSTTNFSAVVDGSAITNQQTQLYFSAYTPLVFNLPRQYTKQLANVGYYYKQFSTQTISGQTVSVTCRTTDQFVPSSGESILSNFVVVRQNGAMIPLDGATITLTTPYTAVINFGTTAYNTDVVNIIATVKTTNDSYRVKTLVSNYIPNSPYTISDTTSQDLLKSDVYSLSAVYEFTTGSTYRGSWSSSTTYVEGDVVYTANAAYFSTSNSNLNNNPTTSNNWGLINNSVSYYTFDNGQTDGYYDHGSIHRNSAPATPIQILPVFSYFTHSGYGYLTPESYPVDYGSIPNYTTASGQVLQLSNCIDFRPRRTDDTTSFVLASHQIPQALSDIDVSADITYYLGRIDKAVLTRDGLFKILEGVPAYLNPQPPANQSDSITLFQLTYTPYTVGPTGVNVQVIPHKRYTMRDISNLDNRLTNIEYTTSLNALESQTNSQVITNSNGTTLFKNGYIIDTFNGNGIGDVTNPEYRAAIDYSNGLVRPTYTADNVYLTFNGDSSSAVLTDKAFGSLVTVPYTSNVFVNQPIASNTISVNPFGVVNFVGTLNISPQSDVWFDTNTAPLVISNPNGSNDNYVTSAGIETQWNAWQNIWVGEQINDSTTGYVGPTTGSIVNSQLVKTTTTTTTTQAPGVSSTTSTSVVNNSVIPYARGAMIKFRVDGMAANTQLYLWINNINMTQFLYPSTIVAGTITANPGVKTDNSGSAIGFITFPGPNSGYPQPTGPQNIIIADNGFDWTKSVSYAQATYYTEGLLETIKSSVISTKPNSYVTTQLQVSSTSNYATDVIQSANVAINVLNVPPKVYTLTSDKTAIVEGGTINFLFSATNIPPNSKFNANISGFITGSDIAGSSYSLGNNVITTTGTLASSACTISIPINASAVTGYNSKYIILEVDVPDNLGGPLQLISNVAIQTSQTPTFTTSATSSLVLGSASTNTATISISGANLPSAQTISYVMTGVGSSYIYSGNSATGTFTLGAPNGSHTLNFEVANSYPITGGDALTVTFTMPDGTVKKTSTNIGSGASYALNSSSSTVLTNSASGFVITLITKGVATGTSVPYTITGVTSAELSGASLTGSFTVGSDGTASISYTTIAETTDLNFLMTLSGVSPTVSVPVFLHYVPPTVGPNNPKMPTVTTPIILLLNGSPVSATNSTINCNTPFTWGVQNGPLNGSFFYTATSGGTVVGTSPTIPLGPTGSQTYNVANGVPNPGTVVYNFTFSDGRTATATIIFNAVAATWTLTSSAASVNQGDNFTFTITSSGQSANVSIPYTINNPGNYNINTVGSSGGVASQTTYIVAGGADYAAYVESYADLIAAYTDGLSYLPGGTPTTYYAQEFPNGWFSSSQQEYQVMLGGTSDWSVYAAQGLAAFGQWHYQTYGQYENRVVPIDTTINGTLTMSDSSSPVTLTLNVSPIYTTTTSNQITLNLNGAVNKSVTVKINNTAQSLLPSPSNYTYTAPVPGDFVDSPLTIAQALGAYTYYTDGLTAEQVLADTNSYGKIWITHAQAANANTYGNIVANYYRNASILNRNPDLGGFIFWTSALFWAQQPSSQYNQVYPITYGSTGSDPTGFSSRYAVWVNPGLTQQCGTVQATIRSFTILSGGTYYAELSADDWAQLYVDGTMVLDFNFANFGSSGEYLVPNKNTTGFTLSPGLHYVTVLAVNAGNKNNADDSWFSNPGWWAATITDSNSNLVWDSRSSAATPPSTASALTLAQAEAIVAAAFNEAAALNGEPVGNRSQFLACTTDPLSQTFFVPTNIYPNGIFLSGFDLFFASKDPIAPVFAQIRPTLNGYPSSDTVMPLSTVWLDPNSVNVSTDASVATHFAFTDPIYLPAGEYAIVVGSNSQKYTAFIGTVGQIQIGTTNTIVNQPNVGSLFKSQNASTWTADQTSDLCFVLYQSIFKTGTTYKAYFESSAPTQTFEFELVELVTQELDFNNTTSITYGIRNQYDGVPDSAYNSILSNQNYVLNSVKNVTNIGDSNVIAYMTTTDPNVSPVIDLDRMSMIMVHNVVNDPTTISIPETTPIGGGAAAKYVTRSVTLSEGFEATGITVYFDLNAQSGSSVDVYVKVLAADDNDSLQNKPWQYVPPTSPITNYSKSYSDFMPAVKYQLTNISYVSGGTQYNNFQTFAVKVVMYSNNSAIVPQIANFGAIATS